MAKHIPKDLVTGSPIDLNVALSIFNRKEYHHVFPNAYLTGIDLPKNKRFSLLNFCFLTSSSNKKISSKKPSIYVQELLKNDGFSKTLESNLLPTKREPYLENDYNAFLSARATTVLAEIDKVTS